MGGIYANTSVLSHEIGHCLGLYHTHSGSGCYDYANCSENINGSNCSNCGDLVCDTPADPCLSGKVDDNCNYVGGGGYSPDVHNIMSYSSPHCLNNITLGQMNRIHFVISNSVLFNALSYTPSIYGASVVCSSNSTFSIQNKPQNSTIRWSCSNNLSIVNGQGSDNFTVKGISNGNGWIQAIINGVNFRKDIWVGKPDFDLETDASVYSTNMYGIASLDYMSGSISNVSWSKSGAIASITGGPVVAKFKTSKNAGIGEIYAYTTNICGVTEKRKLVRVEGFVFNVYPNPTTNNISIEVIENLSSHTNKQQDREIEVNLYDKNFNLQKSIKTGEKLVSMNLSDLRPDIYILKIIVNGQEKYEKIIKTE